MKKITKLIGLLAFVFLVSGCGAGPLGIADWARVILVGEDSSSGESEESAYAFYARAEIPQLQNLIIELLKERVYTIEKIEKDKEKVRIVAKREGFEPSIEIIFKEMALSKVRIASVRGTGAQGLANLLYVELEKKGIEIIL